MSVRIEEIRHFISGAKPSTAQTRFCSWVPDITVSGIATEAPTVPVWVILASHNAADVVSLGEG